MEYPSDIGLRILIDQNTTYDQQTLAVMKLVLRRDSNCIDLGAHKGDILQHMVTLAPEGVHHAFEPLPHLAAFLRKQFPGVSVHQAAAGDTNGRTEFQHVENAPAYSGIRRRIYDRPDPEITTIEVDAIALDDVVPPERDISFMKLDIEGGEYHALKGATGTIHRSRPVIVFEAGRKSTGQYGVEPADMYMLITERFGYDLSTMARWLARSTALTQEEFCHNWHNGPDYYFIATASGVAA